MLLGFHTKQGDGVAGSHPCTRDKIDVVGWLTIEDSDSETKYSRGRDPPNEAVKFAWRVRGVALLTGKE